MLCQKALFSTTLFSIFLAIPLSAMHKPPQESRTNVHTVVTLHNTTHALCSVVYKKKYATDGHLQKIIQVVKPENTLRITDMLDGTYVEISQRISGQTERWHIPPDVCHLFILAASQKSGFLIKNGTPVTTNE